MRHWKIIDEGNDDLYNKIREKWKEVAFVIPNEWEKYKSKETDAILDELLTEQIQQQERRRGETGSRAQANTRFGYAVAYAVIVVLWAMMPLEGKSIVLPLVLAGTLLYFLYSSGKGQESGCALPIVAIMFVVFTSEIFGSMGRILLYVGYVLLTVEYGLILLSMGKSGRLKALKKLAKASPDKDLMTIVTEDSYIIGEEHKIIGSRWVSLGIIALGLVLSILITASGIVDTGSAGNTEATEAPNLDPQARYTWELGENGYILTDFDVGTQEVTADIPAEIDGVPVVAIGESAFANETALTKVTMPGSITEIGSYAFKNCSSLSELVLSENLTAIGGEAFYGCGSLTSFAVPDGVTEIRGNTFQYCTSLKNVTLHNGITAIHAYAFNGCSNLQYINLPDYITEIRANTFENCTSLRSIVIPEGVTRIAAHAFRNCDSLADVTVPSTVTEIGSSAFRDCDSLKEIAIPFGCAVDERSFKDSPVTITFQ